MSKMNKKARIEAEAKAAKKKTMLTILAVVLIVAAIAGLIILLQSIQPVTRTYEAGNARVVLNDNKTFNANLWHDVRSGTYTEKTENNITTVTFNENGRITYGIIENEILTIPDEWDDDHGHGSGTVFKLRK